MNNQTKLPKKIPVFPLLNFIFFPNTSAPLNIFEPRYIQMIDDSMKSDRIIGMIQPKKTGDLKKPDLFKIGCMGKPKSGNSDLSGAGRGWDPSGWICIDVRTPETLSFPYLGHLGIS